MKIEDDFLDQEEFDNIQSLMMKDQITWCYSPGIVRAPLYNSIENEDNDFQFTHSFYFNSAPQSPFFYQLNPILEILNPMSLWRTKANLLTRTPDIIENLLHTDIGDLDNSPEQLKQWTTSIFYVNTNDGYTKFEDGSIVESVANRMVTFPSNIKHTGTSCTNKNTRVVINFNYFKRES